jgi:hypothetical protein
VFQFPHWRDISIFSKTSGASCIVKQPRFPGYKEAKARNQPLTSSYYRVYEWVGLYLHSFTCRQDVHRGNFAFNCKAHLLYYLFMSSVLFTSVYFLQVKSLTRPCVNFERDADTTDMQSDATIPLHDFLCMSTHLCPSVSIQRLEKVR